MKAVSYFFPRLLLFSLFLVLYFGTSAQDSSGLKIISPYDSLVFNEVKAIGNPTTGNVELSIRVRTDYHKLTDVYFALGAFSDLGATDDKGNKYKIFTDEHLLGAAKINQGFLKIEGVQFGQKKLDRLTYVKDTLRTGQSDILIIRLGKVDKTVGYLKEFHIRCILTLNYMWVGDKSYQVQNVKIQWLQPAKK